MSAALTDAGGTPVAAGDHIVPLARPLEPSLVVHVDLAAGRLFTLAGDDLPARLARVVTVRDALGARLAEGDTVIGVDQAGAQLAGAPTWVISRVHYCVGMLTVAGGPDGRAPTVTLPALVVRVAAAVTAGDQVVDDAGVVGVVLDDDGTGWVLVEPMLTGEPAALRRRGELRRLSEAHPGVHEDAAGGFTVPALDTPEARAAGDVAAIMAGTWAANVVPLPRRAG